MTHENPTRLFVGRREDVIAEVGGMSHIYGGKYLIQPDGEGNYDAEGADTLKDAKEMVKEFSRVYPGIQVVWL